MARSKSPSVKIQLSSSWLQAELPEEDMDVRGGGRDAEMERVTRDDGYGSDNEVDSRTNASWSAQRISIGSQPPKNRSIAAIQSQASHAVSFPLPRHKLVHEWRQKIFSLFVQRGLFCVCSKEELALSTMAV